MKVFNLFFALAIFAASSAAFSAPATYSGSSKYTVSWCPNGQSCGAKPSFSALEQLGVRKAAEENAVNNCYSAGHSACYASTSEVTVCNGTEFSGGILNVICEASATAVGFNH